MNKSEKHVFFMFLTLLIMLIVLVSVKIAMAEEQVFTVVISPTPTPKPVYREAEVLPEYDLDDNEVEILCKLLWSSPLRSDSAKTTLLWCVFRRVDAGYPFGGSIAEVVNDTEFTFYDRKARVSDKNREIVEREMTRWLADKDGYGIGRKPPKNALYCRFTGKYNRNVELMSEPHGKALQW